MDGNLDGNYDENFNGNNDRNYDEKYDGNYDKKYIGLSQLRIKMRILMDSPKYRS